MNMEDKFIEHTQTTDVICPFCGHILMDSWELFEGGGEIDCSKCDKKYRYRKDIEVTYSTEKII